MKNALFLIFISHFSWAATVIPESKEVQEITVAAPRIQNSVEALLEIRKKTQNVADVLGAEAMSRNGDSDAASSLRRVTGLTLVNGKYVYVRGLGERYSSVLLNGSQVPSPEPSRRVVPLDLFPISILESITVQKSFSPNRPAEFGGGLIELQTKLIPREFTGSLSLGLSSDQFNSGLNYVGGKNDFLGFDDGTREMPNEIKAAFQSKKKLIISESEGFTEKEIVELGNKLSNNYNVKNKKNQTIPNLQISFGDSTNFKNYKMGGLFGGIYSTSFDNGQKTSRSFNIGAGEKLEKEDESVTSFSESEIQLGGASNLGFAYKDDFKLNLNTIFLRNSTNSTQVKVSERKSDSFSSRQYTTLEWVERQLFLNQLSGNHDLDRIKINWRVNKSIATRESPDTREVMRNFDNGQYVLETDVTGNKRVFSELKDESSEYGLDTEFDVIERESFNVKFLAGVTQNIKDRKSDVYRLHFKNNFNTNSLPDLSQDSETLLGNRGKDSFLLTNLTDSADSFSGEQKINSYYGLIESKVGSFVSLNFGMRKETSSQRVKTFKYYEPDKPSSEGYLKMDDLLPSYGGSINISEGQKIRIAYGETIARPDFRELSTISYIEDETGYDVIGNNELKGTIIKNWDLRFENYFDDTDYFSVGGFYKSFTAPIEAIFQPGDKLVKTFTNASAAKSYGAELEGRSSLRHISRHLRRWSLSANYSLIKSQVEIDKTQGNQTSLDRPLQGQSPYVVNLQLFYDRPQLNITSGLIFNVIGRRITEVGVNARPDTYEEPFQQLDFVFNQKFKEWGYGFKAKNLLDPKAESTQGEEIVRSRNKGRSYAFNVSTLF
jgi:hypothetical protein